MIWTNKMKCDLFDKETIKRFFSENYALLSVLVGFVLVSLSIGPYQNGDTQYEFQAASGILKWGIPYTNSFGNLVNQPPLGFYIQALLFKAFGASIQNGVLLTTLFGLGCVFFVYVIGKVIYNKTTGLLAAVLLAFTPWHLILSRSFLIDVQCLFFSLFSLSVGLIAVRKNSFKLFIASGFIFAAAFSTKLYAIFTLIPFLLYFVYIKRESFVRALCWVVAYVLPVLLISYLWYDVITNQGMFSIFYHSDLIQQNVGPAGTSYFFVSNFLTGYALGWFFIDAAILSLLVCFAQRKALQSFFVFDLICVIAIVCVVGTNMFLGVTLNLRAPYLNAIKYDYQALPFFALLAASLARKSLSMFKSAKQLASVKRKLFFFVAAVGLVLVFVTIFYSIYFINLFSTWNYLLFRVTPNVNLGYSLFNYAPIGRTALLWIFNIWDLHLYYQDFCGWAGINLVRCSDF